MLHIPSLGLRTAQPIDLQTGKPTSMQYTSMRYGMAFTTLYGWQKPPYMRVHALVGVAVCRIFIGLLNVRSSKMKDYVLVTPCLYLSACREADAAALQAVAKVIFFHEKTIVRWHKFMFMSLVFRVRGIGNGRAWRRMRRQRRTGARAKHPEAVVFPLMLKR